MSDSNGTRFFEDFEPGQTFDLGTYPPLSEDDIITFARQWDPQYFHVDPEAAKDSMFKGLVASGWHTCVILMNLFVTNFPGLGASLGSPGLDNVRFIRPVRPGDSLSGRLTVLDTQPSSSRPAAGKVQTRMELLNQEGDLVCSVQAWGFYARRSPALGG